MLFFASFAMRKRSVLHFGTDLLTWLGHWERKYVLSQLFAVSVFFDYSDAKTAFSHPNCLI